MGWAGPLKRASPTHIFPRGAGPNLYSMSNVIGYLTGEVRQHAANRYQPGRLLQSLSGCSGIFLKISSSVLSKAGSSSTTSSKG